MTLEIKHSTVVSSVDYADDPSVPVGTNEWNDAHDITLSGNRLVGRLDTSAGPAGELTADQVKAFLGVTGGLVSSGTYTILAMGQSNMNNTQSYSWTPPSNLEFWNWDGTESGVGTAFAALPGTQAAFPFSFAAEVARMNPNIVVRLLRISFGGKPIEQWIGGWKYLWSSTTTSGNPGSGNIRFNNATASAVTEIYVSYYDKDGYDKQGSTGDTGVSSSDNKLRIYKPADPTAYIEYTISSIANVSTTHKTYTVTHAQTVGSVSLADTNEIRMLRSPDLYYALDRNMTAAISAAGFDKIDLMLWWQGESNARSAAAYPDEFDELIDKLRDEAWYDYATPVVVCMHSPFTASNFAAMSNTMQKVVVRDVDTRAIINPGALPVSFWDPVADYIHMLPEGYMRAGEMCARAYYTTGRATVDGITTDLTTGFIGLADTTTPRAPAHVTWTDPPAGVVQRIENTGTLGALTQYKGSSQNWGIGKLPSNNHFGLLFGTDSYGAGGVPAAGTEYWRITALGLMGLGDTAPGYHASFKKSGAARGLIASINSGDSGSIVGAQIHYVQAGLTNWAAGIGTDGAWHVYANRTSTADGTDVLKITSSAVTPGADNTISCGGAALRWSVVYAATGTINTSDKRAKANISDVDLPLLRAWSRVRGKTFQMADSVAEKGDAARRHVGYVAQDVEAAFAAEGLDARKYALWCEDAVSAPVAIKRTVRQQRVANEAYVYDEAGEPIFDEIEIDDTEMRPTGETRLGLRYEQCAALDGALNRYVLGCLAAGRPLDPVIASQVA